MSTLRFNAGHEKPKGCPPLAAITNELSRQFSVSQADFQRCRDLKEGVPGWSTLAHYVVFRELLRNRPSPSVLVCGVYHGLDLRYLAGIADDLGQKIQLVGVDTFSAEPSADAPNTGKTWQEAWQAPPPSIEAARQNCPTATIHQGDSVAFMQRCHDTGTTFDLIWLDSCHTEEHVLCEITAARAILNPGGLLAGDDYASEAKTFGVDKAVRALLPHHIVLFDRIWLATVP